MKKLLGVILLTICCLTVLVAFAEAEMPEGHTLTLLGEFNFDTMTKKPDLVGLMDDNEKTVIKPQFDAMNNLGGGWWTAEKDGKVGLANTLGKIVQKPVFDSITRNEDGTFNTVSEDNTGLLSINGTEMIKPGAMNYTLLGNGVYLVEQKEKYGLMSSDGKTIAKPAYDSIELQSDGTYLVKSKDLYGLLAENGKVICKPTYSHISAFGENSFVVKNNKGVASIIDINGKPVDKVGNTLFFGHYEQDGQRNGAEPIEWIVIDRKDSQLMLISKYALACRGIVDRDSVWNYDTTKKIDLFWEDTPIRKWLNTSFFEKAFSESEQKAIATTLVDNKACMVNKYEKTYSANGTDGNDTYDKVYLLSYPEVAKYYKKDKDRVCEPTDYALNQGINIERKTGLCSWWLRTPGYHEFFVMCVSDSGYAHEDYCASNGVGVRPVIWLDMSLLANDDNMESSETQINADDKTAVTFFDIPWGASQEEVQKTVTDKGLVNANFLWNNDSDSQLQTVFIEGGNNLTWLDNYGVTEVFTDWVGRSSNNNSILKPFEGYHVDEIGFEYVRPTSKLGADADGEKYVLHSVKIALDMYGKNIDEALTVLSSTFSSEYGEPILISSMVGKNIQVWLMGEHTGIALYEDDAEQIIVLYGRTDAMDIVEEAFGYSE